MYLLNSEQFHTMHANAYFKNICSTPNIILLYLHKSIHTTSKKIHLIACELIGLIIGPSDSMHIHYKIK